MALKWLALAATVLACLATATSGAPACANEVARFGTCGGLGSGCIGSQCRDGPWPDTCCPAGQQCNRKTPYFYKCEDTPLTCPPYSGTTCAKLVPTYGTCGGLASGCTGCQCKDGLWDGFCCAPGSVCNRKTPFYYKCEPAATTPVGAAPASLDPIDLSLITTLINPPAGVPPAAVVTPPVTPPVKPAVAVVPAAPAEPAKPEPAAASSGGGAACVGSPIALYETCGGKGSGCATAECRDGPWPGKCCVGVCVRKTAWYWKCEEAPQPACPPYTGPACGIKVVDEWATCGGQGSGCERCSCRDAPWAGYCCPAGFRCQRKTQWHWRCEK